METLEDRTLLSGISGFNGGNGWTPNTNGTGNPTFGGNSVTLTDFGGGEAQSAIYNTAQPIVNWIASFNYQATQFPLLALADGVTFVLENQATNPTNALGQTGGALGYYGITPSVAIKFDLYNNQGEGINSTGFYENGAYPGQPSDNLDGTGIDLQSGHVFNVAVSYNGSSQIVTWTITDITPALRCRIPCRRTT